MIYTLTLNPSLDVIYKVDDIHFGSVNLISGKSSQPGGKGINVSLMLHVLGIPSVIFGIVAGLTGQQIQDNLDACGMKNDFIFTDTGESRMNLKFLAGSTMTEFNESGPLISEETIHRIYEKLDLLEKDDYLVISGRVHPSMDKSIYRNIMEYLNYREINIIIDAKAELLLPCLPLHPFLIKPNLEELAEIFEIEYQDACSLSDEDLEEYAFQLVEMGARNVIISLGARGAVLASESGQCIKIPGFEGRQISPVGAGDSLVAGFIAGYIETGDLQYALELGSACGAATAFSLWLGTKKQIEELLERL